MEITVKPGSKKGPSVQPDLLGGLLVYVREPARGGKANQAVIELVAEYLGVPKSRLRLTRGRKSRHKFIEVDKA